MRFPPIRIIFSATFAFSFLVSPVSAETIVTNLTVGSRGMEVSTLQQTLVSQGYLVMPSGVSYGYFGSLTQAAVVKWQKANGVTPALGYFGPVSRAIFTQQTSLTSATVLAPTPSPSIAPAPPDILPSVDTPYAFGMRANRIMLFRASPFEVRPGDFITLDGSSFSKTSNKVYFNGSSALAATSTNGSVIETFVPASLAEGEYKLSVSNVLGSSDNPDIRVTIKVTNNPQPAPSIESASITGDTVTLIGKGFTSSNNLFTTLGDSSSPLSSDGTTLTFRVTDLSRYNQVKQFTVGKYQAALWIFVQNEHGISREPHKLEIII